MTLGEKIRKYRLLHNLRQKDLGMMVGFSSSTADSRIRKYEGDLMAPKSEIRNKLVQALDVDPSALSDIDIRSIEDVVRTFFFMEEYLGFEIESFNSDQLSLFNKEKTYYSKWDISTLNSYMYIWYEQKKNLLNIKNDNQEDSNKEYELWKSRFPRDIYTYWNSLIEKIDAYYTPFVNEISNKKTKIVYSSEFIAQIRKLIQSGLEFKVDSEIRDVNDGYLVLIFKVSDLLSPKSKEIEIQFTEFLNNLKTLKEYGMIIDTTALTFTTGNIISYHMLLNPLMKKCGTIQELIQFEKNKASMDEFSIELFNINYDKEFNSSNLNLQEEIEVYYQ
jgi:transcriptional regulator with XRE-family HTH domain